MKPLLVTKRLHPNPAGGRELLCTLNRDALADIAGGRLATLELEPTRVASVRSIGAAMRGHIDGLNDAVINAAISRVRAEDITDVFIDGSNLGAIAAALKQAVPDVRIITFFHNVESRFFLGSLRQHKTPRALAVLLANYLAERRAVRSSDILIMLSARDSALLERVYGQPGTVISPMALADKLPPDQADAAKSTADRYLLFVGGSFYANRAGILWFVQNVVPRIGMRLCVVGKGMEDLKPVLERDGKVNVVGAVDDLAEWYRGAHLVVAPIFDGSGMKTKVAEALMFGKKVVGTPEAFSGYEKDADSAGWTCATADEFVTVIDRMEQTEVPTFDPALRALYETSYSYESARDRLACILRHGSNGRR